MTGTLADAGAGAGNILPAPLYLGRGVKDLFFAWLRRQHPELLSTYADLYAHGWRTPRHYRDLVWALVDQALQRHGLPIPDDTTSDNFALLGRRFSVIEPTAPTLF
ncbi:MAG: hypothetical protein WA890_09945 [Micromonospora sp.]